MWGFRDNPHAPRTLNNQQAISKRILSLVNLDTDLVTYGFDSVLTASCCPISALEISRYNTMDLCEFNLNNDYFATRASMWLVAGRVFMIPSLSTRQTLRENRSSSVTCWNCPCRLTKAPRLDSVETIETSRSTFQNQQSVTGKAWCAHGRSQVFLNYFFYLKKLD